MNIIEAAEHLRNGKSIRQKTWVNPDEHIYNKCGELKLSNGQSYNPGILSLTSDNWEIYDNRTPIAKAWDEWKEYINKQGSVVDHRDKFAFEAGYMADRSESVPDSPHVTAGSNFEYWAKMWKQSCPTEIHPMDKAWEEFKIKNKGALPDGMTYYDDGRDKNIWTTAWQAAEKHFRKSNYYIDKDIANLKKRTGT